jgi:hypothetical protein
MKRDSNKAFFVIFGLLLFYIPVKLLGDAVQRSETCQSGSLTRSTSCWVLSPWL